MRKITLFILTAIMFNFVNANDAVIGNQNRTNIIINDDYVKIKSSELPSPVVDAILKEYPTSKLRQAYKNKQNKYKLIMVLSSGTARTVYLDAYGRWIQKKNKLR